MWYWRGGGSGNREWGGCLSQETSAHLHECNILGAVFELMLSSMPVCPFYGKVYSSYSGWLFRCGSPLALYDLYSVVWWSPLPVQGQVCTVPNMKWSCAMISSVVQ